MGSGISMTYKDKTQPLSENEAALFAALTAVIRTLPPGPHRTMLAGLLAEERADFLQDGKPQAAALLGLLASYAETGEA
jgi:hypothetical protein